MSSIAIATCLPVAYYGYLQSTVATCSVLRLPVVYYDYTYSLPSVLPRLLYSAILYYVNLVFIITTPVLLKARSH